MTDEAPVDDPSLPTVPAEPVALDLPKPLEPEHEHEHEHEEPDAPKSPRRWLIPAIAAVAGLVIGAFIFLGHSNAQSYELVCTADKIIAEQGRTFPPWGTHAMTDPEWKPIDIVPKSKCVPNTTEDRAVLASWFVDALYDSAQDALTPHPGQPVTKLDLAEQQVNQALVLLRGASKTIHNRDELQRWLANATYWRTQQKLHDAITGLGDLANQFDQAAASSPHDVVDSHQWADYIRKTQAMLKAGPAAQGSTANAPPPPEDMPGHVGAPLGAALPVEPGKPSEAQPAAPPPDAGVPTGGVLL